MENKNEMLQVPQRDIEVVTGEINELTRQAGQMMLVFAIEVGRRLTEAKSLLPHGEWGNWLKEKVHFSQSHANDLMKIFEEYGADQITIFGAVAKSQTIGNLPYTKALALLKIPSEEREEFIENNDIGSLSVRDLQKVIKEREEAEAKAKEAQHRAAELKGQLANAEAEIADLKAEADTKVAAAREAADREQALRDQLAEAKLAQKEAEDSAEAARAEMDRVQKDPAVSEDAIKKIAAEERKKAKEKQKEALEKLTAEAEKNLSEAVALREAAEREAKEARDRAEELEKQLKMADPLVAEFKVRINTVMGAIRECTTALEAIRKQDADTAGKLEKALRAAVDQSLGGASHAV